MQRIVNDPNQVVEEMLHGFVKSHPDLVAPIPENPWVLKYVKAPTNSGR
jgi:phosphoenolpyruvate---glycerone phosphotransferase subunit DhaK